MNLQDIDQASNNRRLKCLRTDDDGRCATFELNDEDHTLGNSLRHMILKNPEVKFCGYAPPHPNERKIVLQIQVYSGEATDALERGLKDLKVLNQIVKEKILAEKERFGPVEFESSDEDGDSDSVIQSQASEDNQQESEVEEEAQQEVVMEEQW